MDDIRLEIKSVLFFLLTTLSIAICSYLVGVNIEVSLMIIFLTNRIYSRMDGFHNSSLKLCWIISTLSFTLFGYLSTQIVITPLILLCAIILVDYERIEQVGSLICVVFIGVTLPEYSWLISTTFFSIVLAWCVNGKSIVSKFLQVIDTKLSKIIK